jgi:Cdc6-like AAA superfamily ATPase
MYLKNIYLENNGPIKQCSLELPFSSAGLPLPVAVVGANGSGKTILISYIVDALVEIAKNSFSDIVTEDNDKKPFFRVVSPNSIKSGCEYSLSLLSFSIGDKSAIYCEKSGKLDPKNYNFAAKNTFKSIWNWPVDGNYKNIISEKELIEKDMGAGSYIFFPTSRHEAPDWLNPKGAKIDLKDARMQFSGQLQKPIYVESSASANSSWVLDVFLDSSFNFDSVIAAQSGSQRHVDELNNRNILGQSRRNVEKILKAILQDEEAELILNFRHVNTSRLAIKKGDGQLIPNLNALSTGQSLLFNMFTAIIRYADRSNINMSIHLKDITGIVVIDEIDAHLHASLQYDVVPKLIKLFPKIQFIFSTHAPLLLLGLEQELTKEGFLIIEAPSGKRITSERFIEFKESINKYRETKEFEEMIEAKISEATTPLILTEGQLDPNYIKTALTHRHFR